MPADPTPSQSGPLSTTEIRRVYHRHNDAEPWGYKSEDRIGHAVIDTVAALCDEVDRLRAEVERAHLGRIEAQNPGIDMEEVRRTMAMHTAGEEFHDA